MRKVLNTFLVIFISLLLVACSSQSNSASESSASQSENNDSQTNTQEESLSANYIDGYNSIINSNYSDLAAAGYASVYGPDGNTPDRANAEKFCINIIDMAVLGGSSFSDTEYNDEVAGCTDAVMDKG